MKYRILHLTIIITLFNFSGLAQGFLTMEENQWVHTSKLELVKDEVKTSNALLYLSKSEVFSGCSNLSSAKPNLYFFRCYKLLESNGIKKVKFDFTIDMDKSGLTFSVFNIETNVVGGSYKVLSEITSNKKFNEKAKLQDAFNNSETSVSAFSSLVNSFYQTELKINRPPTLSVLEKEFTRDELYNNNLTLKHIFDVQASKDELYKQLKTWVSLNYRSSDDVIQYDNENEGKLIVKGFFSNLTKGGLFNFEYRWYHTLILESKSNKVRLTMTNIEMQYADIGDRKSIEWWLSEGNTITKRAVNDNMEKSKRMFIEIINDINRNMSAKSDDEW